MVVIAQQAVQAALEAVPEHGIGMMENAGVGSFVTQPLPADVQEAIRPGIIAAAEQWDVQLPVGWSTNFDMNYNRFGNLPITTGGNELYKGIARQLWRFCAVIKDYESMLVLVTPHCPRVPAMKPETIEQFMRYKREAAETPLEDHTGIPVLDLRGNQVYCDGGWKNPKKADHLCSTVKAIHDAFDIHSSYDGFKKACVDCRALPWHHRHRGCDVCAGTTGASTYRIGNPCMSRLVKNTHKNCRDPNYQEHGNSQLTPKDLRRIRDALLATNTLQGLATYTMILCGCKLFGRQDEIGKMKIEHFVPELFLRKDGRVHALCVKIRGKSDGNLWHYRWLWADDECPDLCPVRHLLVYLFLGGFRGGFLFPRSRELNQDNPADGIYTTSVSYSTFRNWFKTFLAQLLQNPNVKVGLHMWRKTAYLLGQWGGGEWADLKASARHKSDKEAEKYVKDAKALQQLQQIFYDPLNRVGTWKSIVCEAPSQASEMVATGSDAQGLPLHQLAEEFVTTSLGCPPGSPHRYNQYELLQHAMKYTCKPTVEEEIRFITNTFHLAPEVVGALQTVVNRALMEQQQRLIAKFQIPQQPEAAQVQFVVSGSNKRKRGGDNDLQGRTKVAKLGTVRDKVLEIQRLYAQIPEKKSELTESARTYVNRTINPVIGCLNNHFDNDLDAFVAHWNDSFKIKFGAGCCDGKGACRRAPQGTSSAS